MNVMNYNPAKVPSVQSSGNLKNVGGFKFDLWSYVEYKHETDKISNTALVIGYIEEGVDDYFYVVIPNQRICSEVEIRIVGLEHLEENFQECKRPGQGMLRRPQVGDQVMCIAKGRYAGVQGGDVMNVLGMPDGRVRIFEGSPATYEDIYFVTCSGASCRATDGTTSQVIGGQSIDGYVDFSSLIDQDEIKKRIVLEADKLIIRKRLDEPEIKRREVFNPELIKRIK